VPQGVCGDLGDSSGVLSGATVVLYGLVGVLGVRIWLTNGVDFSRLLNQTAAIPLIIGIAAI
jgi:xanthine/uracil permease